MYERVLKSTDNLTEEICNIAQFDIWLLLRINFGFEELNSCGMLFLVKFREILLKYSGHLTN